MIAILSVKDPDKKQEICRKAGVPYHEDLHVIASFEDGKMMYGAVFEICREEGTIHWIDASGDDFSVSEGLGKAVLNIMDLRGVKKAFMPLSMEKLAAPLRFSKKEGRYEVEITGYFSCGCDHKK